MAGQHQLDQPDDFWDVVLGSGYWATVDALGQQQRNQLRDRLLGELRARNVTELRTDVVFASASGHGRWAGAPATAGAPGSACCRSAVSPTADVQLYRVIATRPRRGDQGGRRARLQDQRRPRLFIEVEDAPDAPLPVIPYDPSRIWP